MPRALIAAALCAALVALVPVPSRADHDRGKGKAKGHEKKEAREEREEDRASIFLRLLTGEPTFANRAGVRQNIGQRYENSD